MGAYGAIDLGSAFSRTGILPLDGTSTVADITARNAIPAGIRYQGMTTYVLADATSYQLQGGIVDADWVAISGNSSTVSVANALTAFAGGGQNNALALTAQINRITVCATAGDSVKLPAAVAGLQIIVINDGAASADIFPQAGEAINDLAADAAMALTPADANVRFICPVAGLWKSAAGGGGGGSSNTVSSFSLSDNDTLTVDAAKMVQTFTVDGTSAPVVLSLTPFGSTVLVDGAIIYLVGSDDDKPVTVRQYAGTNGIYMDGDVILTKYRAIKIMWVDYLSAYVRVT